MQERNFEKQVQEKMEELSFVPSEPVWKKVEEQIRRKRDRRRIIFWILPLMLLTGAAYFLWSEKDMKEKDTANMAANPSQETMPPQQEQTVLDRKSPVAERSGNSLPSKKLSSPREETVTIYHDSKKQNTFFVKPAQKKTKIQTPAVVQDKSGRLEQDELAPQENTVANADKKTNKEQRTGSKTTKVEGLVRKDDKKNSEIIDNNTTTPASTGATSQEAVTDSATNIASQEIKNKTSNDKEIVAEKKDSLATQDSVTKQNKNTKLIVKKKWSWSTYAIAGVSGLTTGNTKSVAYASPANDLLALNGANFQTAAPAPRQDNAAAPSRDFAFALGASVRRNFSNRVSLKSGLQYNYFSTTVYVGKSVNNEVQNGRLNSQVKANRFYLANSTEKEKYTNQYHYVTVPVVIEWQILEQLPLQVSTGINVSRLVATNALYFDRTQQVYYKDNDHLNKTNLSITGALAYRVLTTKTFGLYAGPQAQLGLNSLRKDNTSGQRLFFAGIQAEVRF